MLKRQITYKTFDGETVTEDFYFYISKPKFIELEASEKGGYSAMVQKIAETDDNQGIVKIFKDFIMMSYGEKSEDGKRFVQSEELSLHFSQTPAYEVLFMELLENEEAIANFLIAIAPEDSRAKLAEEIGKAVKDGQKEEAKVVELPQPQSESPPVPPIPPVPST